MWNPLKVFLSKKPVPPAAEDPIAGPPTQEIKDILDRTIKSLKATAPAEYLNMLQRRHDAK